MRRIVISLDNKKININNCLVFNLQVSIFIVELQAKLAKLSFLLFFVQYRDKF